MGLGGGGGGEGVMPALVLARVAPARVRLLLEQGYQAKAGHMQAHPPPAPMPTRRTRTHTPSSQHQPAVAHA
jgi:hypothetical protein